MIRNLKIKAYQVALVFKNRNLIEVLKEGNYWIFGNKSVEIYEMKNQFLAKEADEVYFMVAGLPMRLK
jgi:hypothetical protein